MAWFAGAAASKMVARPGVRGVLSAQKQFADRNLLTRHRNPSLNEVEMEPIKFTLMPALH